MNIRKHTTIAKGYRLKPRTHKLIKKIQKQINVSQEEIISEALRYYRMQIDLKSNNNNSEHEKN